MGFGLRHGSGKDRSSKVEKIGDGAIEFKWGFECAGDGQGFALI